VPFSNFMGWLLTTFVFLQLFALYLQRQPRFRPGLNSRLAYRVYQPFCFML